jgi:NAD(P)H-dependent flavin oxidoreductase YrpB (nitropropane dioxygenase family)
MFAMNNYDDLAKICVEEGADFIVSGAGLPKDLPGVIEGSKTKAIPIVSSGKAASVILRLWERRYKYVPDAIVLEGPKAGGHLGFSKEDLNNKTVHTLEEIFYEVKEVIKEYEIKHNKKISIIVGGGIFDGSDIAEALKYGADGVQMATRFIATEECDADPLYKKAFVESNNDDISLIQSPVGLPGRAIRNPFINKIENDRIKVTKCYNCLKECDPRTTHYCISKALIEAVKGNIEDGLIFSGSNGYKINKIVSVKELIDELLEQVQSFN